ncbi:MAG: hypothetical protein V1846_03380 [Candidatus Komeilibacteria bacterium]
MTEEHRLALVQATPFSAHVKACLQEATLSGGKVSEPIFRMQLEQTLMASPSPFGSLGEIRRWLLSQILRPSGPLRKPGFRGWVESLKGGSQKPPSVLVREAIDLATEDDGTINQIILRGLVAMVLDTPDPFAS